MLDSHGLETNELEPRMLDTGGLSWRQAELSVTSCAIKLRDYSRLQDKTVKQASSCGWMEPVVILKVPGEHYQGDPGYDVPKEGQTVWL